MLTVIGFLVSVSVVWVFISFLYMRSFVIKVAKKMSKMGICRDAVLLQ